MKLSQVLSITALLAAATATSAQGQLGVMAGVNVAGVSASASGSDVDTDGRTAWNIGAFASRGGLIGFMTGVYYSQKGFGVGGADVDLNYLEVPLMLRVKFLMLRGYAGANLAFELDCVTSGAPTLNGIPFSCDDTESFDFGWKIGAGGTLLLFTLDLAYEWGTTDIWKVDNGSIKNQVFQIDLGLGI
jgi:Outer membrane protein beta-barrel domain